MSYILDALRRADDERQRQGPRVPELVPGPATATTPHRTLNRANRYGTIAATVVITMALASIGAWQWTGQDRSPVENPGADGTATPIPPADRTGVTTIAEPRVQLARPDEPTSTIPDPPAPSSPPRDEPIAEKNASQAMTVVAVPAPVHRPAPAEAVADPPTGPAPRHGDGGDLASISGDLPTAWRDLPLSQRKNLPHPKLDVHVYDANPQRRFVMIKMQKYREGDALPDGSELERIHADGLILVYRGQRYGLPRR